MTEATGKGVSRRREWSTETDVIRTAMSIRTELAHLFHKQKTKDTSPGDQGELLPGRVMVPFTVPRPESPGGQSPQHNGKQTW